MTALEKEKVTLDTAKAIEKAAAQAGAVKGFLSLLWLVSNAMDGDTLNLEHFSDLIELMSDIAQEAADSLTAMEHIEIIKPDKGAAVNV